MTEAASPVDASAGPGPLQFGEPQPGVHYRNRPAAFGVVERDGRVAVVFVTRQDGRYFDLPGGGIDPGEAPEQAVVREFGEETGLRVAPVRVIGRASQFMRQEDGSPANNRSTLFEARWVGDAPELKVEEDHELQWLEPLEAISTLRHDSHAWAVALWLRRPPA